MKTQLATFAALAAQFQTVDIKTFLWLRKSKANTQGAAPIYLRLFYGSERFERSTGIRVTPEEWDAPNGRILGKGKVVQKQNEQLQLMKAHIPELINLMKAVGKKVTLASLRRELIAPKVGKSPCFMEVCQRAGNERDKDSAMGRQRTHFALKAMADWRGLNRLRLPRPLPLDEFTPKLAAEFYHWLLQVRGLKVSSANSMIGTLAGLFRYAAETGEAEINDNPFRALRKQKAAPATERLHLTLAQIATLREAELPAWLSLYRDVYLAQYYLHGSRIGAVLKLRWQDVGADSVRLKVEKGGSQKDIALSEPLRQIFARHRTTESLPHQPVFPLLPAEFFALDIDAQYKAYKGVTSRIGYGLMALAKRLGIKGNLHSHTARHTLAAHAAQVGGIETAQGMLGHTTAAMTAHYAGPQRSPGLDLAERALYGGGEVVPTPAPEPTTPPEGGKVIPLFRAA
ncbi:MAG: tyrosine-type recombinase/integrase [Janthinobacterium lividum]